MEKNSFRLCCDFNEIMKICSAHKMKELVTERFDWNTTRKKNEKNELKNV